MSELYQKVADKEVNLRRLTEEVRAVLPLERIDAAGFVSDNGGRTFTPRTDPKVGTRKIQGSDREDILVVLAGLDCFFDRGLTGPEEAQLDSLISAHSYTNLTPQQTRQDLDGTHHHRIRVLYVKLRDETLTPAERTELLLAVTRMVLRRSDEVADEDV